MKYGVTNGAIINAIINDVIEYAISNDLIKKKIHNIFVFPNTPAQLTLNDSCLLTNGTDFVFHCNKTHGKL